jgi:hypothetical protein
MSHDQGQDRDEEKQNEGTDEDPTGKFSFARAFLIRDFRVGYGSGFGRGPGSSFGFESLGFFLLGRVLAQFCSVGFSRFGFVGHGDSLVQFRGDCAQKLARSFANLRRASRRLVRGGNFRAARGRNCEHRFVDVHKVLVEHDASRKPVAREQCDARTN